MSLFEKHPPTAFWSSFGHRQPVSVTRWLALVSSCPNQHLAASPSAASAIEAVYLSQTLTAMGLKSENTPQLIYTDSVGLLMAHPGILNEESSVNEKTFATCSWGSSSLSSPNQYSPYQ